ncbi:capsular biosynthesis protein [Mammaliicoccus sp. Dog046]|uniref:capsular biosynthesis protein n=1 Tax=Mammaliicoccus sp. Dog046 TaxID=3034233 RepID=UPI002B25A252|nr:capsular biosynthesis protein [Mammaliicoccus sp. Dog046]WQK85148.1 capsular biosynthesis protein [Mammaliicoccus sp. Dog046]
MKLFNYFSICVSFVSLLLILLLNQELLILLILPIVYLFSKILLSSINNTNIKFTKFIFDLYGFIRLVVIPICIVMFNDKIVDNLPLGIDYFDKGAILICIEYLVGTIFLLILSSYRFKKGIINHQKYSDYTLLGNKFVYLIFILISLGLFIVIPGVRETVSFFVIKTNATGRGTEDASSIVILVRMCIQLSLLLIFVLTSLHFYKKYIKVNKIIYVIIPLVIGLINICLIVGERRTVQLYTLIAVLAITSILFKKHKFKINMVIISSGVVILLLMTLYKELYIFNYASYSDALSSKSVSDIKFVDQLQSYFYGPHNVGASIDYLNYYTGNIKEFFYDLVRSTSGLNMFVNKDGLITSQLFNKLIYGNKQLTGHLISSAGYGYIYLGPVLFPLILIFNLTLSTIIENLVKRTNKLEIIFIGTYVYMRVATNIFGNPMPIISMLSSIVVVYGTVVFIAFLIKNLKLKVLV